MSTNESGDVPAGLSDLTPSEVDTLLANVYQRLDNDMLELNRTQTMVHYAINDKRRYVRNVPTWEKTFSEAKDILAKDLESDNTWTVDKAQKLFDTLVEIESRIAVENAKSQRLSAEFDSRGGWVRAFLVISGDGHVHSTMKCSTCNRGQYATRFQWMTEFSGLSEKDVVDAAGWRACTVCYPTAPVGDQASLPTRMFSDDDKAKAKAREEREAKKAAALAKKIANGLTEDGSEFAVFWIEKDSPGFDYQGGKSVRVVRDREKKERFKTERTAVSWAVNILADARYEWAGDYAKQKVEECKPAVDSIIEAVAKKHNKTVDEVTADIEKKVKAKVKRNA